MVENNSNDMDRFSDIARSVEKINLTKIEAYAPIHKCVSDVNRRINAYSPRIRFIISESEILSENYLLIAPTFVGSDQPQIIVDLDSNYNYVIKSGETVINVTKDNLRKILLDCMYTTIENYMEQIAPKKTMENTMEETTACLGEYLEKFETVVKVAERNHEPIKELHKEIDKWVSDVNSIVKQSKLTNLWFYAGTGIDHIYINAEFGRHPLIHISYFKDGKYRMSIGIYERIDLTKEGLKQEVLSGMLRMVSETLLVDLKSDVI